MFSNRFIRFRWPFIRIFFILVFDFYIHLSFFIGFCLFLTKSVDTEIRMASTMIRFTIHIGDMHATPFSDFSTFYWEILSIGCIYNEFWFVYIFDDSVVLGTVCVCVCYCARNLHSCWMCSDGNRWTNRNLMNLIFRTTSINMRWLPSAPIRRIQFAILF